MRRRVGGERNGRIIMASRSWGKPLIPVLMREAKTSRTLSG